MLSIKNLHVSVDGKPILDGLTPSMFPPAKCTRSWGRTGRASRRLSYALAGRPGYEVTAGSVTLDGEDLLALEPNERAAKGVFLSFQYPTGDPRRAGA